MKGAHPSGLPARRMPTRAVAFLVEGVARFMRIAWMRVNGRFWQQAAFFSKNWDNAQLIND